MEFRKVQEMGGGTFLISLPKEWVRKNSIKKGNMLTVDVGNDGFLTIYPFEKKKKEISEILIKYPAEYIEYVINDITGSYLLGYDIIKIQSKDGITFYDTGMIKKAIDQLIGLEIVEEDEYSITAQFLLEPTSLTPDKVFRRMHMISKRMCKDAISSLVDRDEHLVKIVIERDDELDRLHFFLVRLIRSALSDSKLLVNFELNLIDCLDYRVASSLLETIGDVSVEIVQNVSALPKFTFSHKLRNWFIELKESLEKMQDITVKAFLTKSVKDARQAVKVFNILSIKLNQYEKIIPSQPLSVFMGLSTLFTLLNKICHYNVDIADLAVPIYLKIR